MKRVTLFVVIGVVIVGLLAFPAMVNLVTEWWWFSSVGFQTVFTKSLLTKIWLGAGAGVLAFVAFFLNFRFAQRGVVPDPVVVNFKTREPKSIDLTKGLRRVAAPISIVMAVPIAASASGAWLIVLEFLNQTSFDIRVPHFDRDVSYFVFGLPAIEGAIAMVQAITVLCLFMVIPVYFMRGDISALRNRINIEPSAQNHLAVLIAILFLTAVFSTYLVNIPGLLFSNTGRFFGASYTDLAARLPIMRASGALALLCSAWVLWGAKQRALVRNTLVAVGTYVVFTGLLGAAVPGLVQSFIVVPNEVEKETPQLEHNIAATRAAWGIDDVEERYISGESQLTLEDVRANEATIRNVRLWDREPLLQTFGQLQEIRTYYDFVSVDDDRYIIDGELRQVLLSPRELNSQLLPRATFPNERLTFTHGMGLTLSPVNQVTVQGLPVLFIQDLPPSSNVSVQVTRPEIYYGELSSDWVFTNTAQPEFDYPSGDSSAYTSYAGEGGVRVSGLISKALLSARFQSLKVLMSSAIDDNSRVLMHRNIRQRAEKVFPFLRFDSDPYIVVTDEGRLKWMLDAYTTSRRYPYSEPVFADGTNYMRNSVKVVVDAYDGDITGYIADSRDPIVQTYEKIFSGILQPIDAMPADLRSHVRYPEDLFRAQTALYTIYHMEDPEVFYQREDEWQIPATSSNREGSRDPFMRHIVMKLPGEDREEFILMTPFTPREKENLAAWMVARNDGDVYGQLRVYRFPRQSLVFGPRQIANRIDQDTEVSRQLSLWDQRGSEVIRGNLLVIPIEEALVFVQAIYLRAEGGRIPELKRVVVAYENQVVMEGTLDRGLQRLFGGSVERSTPLDLMQLPVGGLALADSLAAVAVDSVGGIPLDNRVGGLAAQIQDAYERALEAQRLGDWAGYGREIEQLGTLVRELVSRTGGGR